MIAYFALIIAEYFSGLLPRNTALKLGPFLGNLWYFLDPKRRHIAKRNILYAYGKEKSYSQICRLVRNSFRHAGIVFVDSLSISKYEVKKISNLIKIEGADKVEQAFAKGKGVLFAIPHFGNWEILVLLGDKFSRPLYDIARQIDNPRIERHILRLRKQSGMRFIGKNDAARKIISSLRTNCGVGIFMDQNAGREGIYINFFGRKASTYPTVSIFASRTGAEVLIIYCILQPDGTYKIVIEEPIGLIKTDERGKDEESNTAAIMRQFEKIIRLYPEQYFWVHQRWKPIQNELMRREFRRVESIVIKAPNWMGDIIMAIPAIKYVRQVFPEAKIIVLIKESLSDLLRYDPNIDELITYNIRRKLMRIIDELRIIRQIRRNYSSLAIIFPYSISSTLWMWIAGVPIRLGTNVRKRGAMLTHPISPKMTNEHQRNYFVRVVRRLGTHDIATNLDISIGNAELRKADNLLRQFKIETLVRIGIHPGAAYGPAKRWLSERFAELAVRLGKDGIAVMLFGSENEKNILNEIAEKANGKAINLCGQFSIGELAAMMSKCDVVVANDSGPMHLAGAIGTPVVAIFGSTSPQATSPYGECEIIRKNVDCSPCFRRECLQDFKCMKSISTDEVYLAVKRMLDRKGRK